MCKFSKIKGPLWDAVTRTRMGKYGVNHLYPMKSSKKTIIRVIITLSLKDYLEQELIENERIIFQNESCVVLTPFWAMWPFETMIVPKSHKQNIAQLEPKEQVDFSKALSVITKAYDKLFNTSFPYSSGIHQSPTNNKNNIHWHWHMSFYPPLLRSATVKKFMVGYEMFGMPQRDITAEQAAQKLSDLIKISSDENKIIVTGGCGYIGSHTAIELIDNNFEVVIVDDLSNATEVTIDRIESITGYDQGLKKLTLKILIELSLFLHHTVTQRQSSILRRIKLSANLFKNP